MMVLGSGFLSHLLSHVPPREATENLGQESLLHPHPWEGGQQAGALPLEFSRGREVGGSSSEPRHDDNSVCPTTRPDNMLPVFPMFEACCAHSLHWKGFNRILV